MVKIDGVVPVLPAPFLENEELDEDSLRRVVEFVASRHAVAMCLPAYGTEFYKLNEAERERMIGITIEVNGKRIPVIAQANHGSAMIASRMAEQYEAMGADVISFALPRQFASTQTDLLRYCGRIAEAVSVPILIQDFNPGGPTVDADFIATLHGQHPNFRYVKLEEPMIVNKLIAIRDRIGDAVGILEGWDGYYMLEAIPAGICGIMPGVPLLEPLDRAYRARQNGDDERAYDLLGSLLPFMNFTLQDFELFIQVEKRLLVRRGLISTPVCRSLTCSPSPAIDEHIEFLIRQVGRVLERERIELRPSLELPLRGPSA